MTIGDCRLCETRQVEIRNSHIIPEFFYTHVYTKNHKFVAINRASDERLEVEQKGYREPLLCNNCEVKLSRWENKLSRLMNEITEDSYKHTTAMKIENITILTNIDYYSIKMAVLSIFWRLSISSLDIFSCYNLGPYADNLKRILHNDLTPISNDYPILISRCLLDNNFQKGILAPIGKGKYENLTMQSIVLNGILFDCIISTGKKPPNEIAIFSIQQSGQVIISTRPYEELGLDVAGFSKRMKMDDVSKFYLKHG